jgi:hypothetical protein
MTPGSPFRSELEQLQEQLRRSEEKIRDAESKADVLAREKKWLEKQVSLGRRPVTWTAAGIVALSLFGVGAIFLTTRVELSKARAAAEIGEVRCTARERAERDLRDSVTNDLESCRKDLLTCKGETYNPPPPLNPTSPSCNCQPGDPLCECPDPPAGPPFDRGAAAAALGRMDLATCVKPSRAVTFHMTVTFAATGHVSSAIVDSDTSGSLLASEKQCMTDRMKASVSIPKFGGAPVRVGKSYSVGGGAL